MHVELSVFHKLKLLKRFASITDKKLERRSYSGSWRNMDSKYTVHLQCPWSG